MGTPSKSFDDLLRDASGNATLLDSNLSPYLAGRLAGMVIQACKPQLKYLAGYDQLFKFLPHGVGTYDSDMLPFGIDSGTLCVQLLVIPGMPLTDEEQSSGYKTGGWLLLTREAHILAVYEKRRKIVRTKREAELFGDTFLCQWRVEELFGTRLGNLLTGEGRLPTFFEQVLKYFNSTIEERRKRLHAMEELAADVRLIYSSINKI